MSALIKVTTLEIIYKSCYMKVAAILFLLFTTLACNDYTLLPEFRVSKDSICAEIQKVVKSESIFIEGFAVPIADSIDVFLTVQLTNPKYLPIGNDSLTVVAKKIAILVKSYLKNENQFKVYDIGISQKEETKKNIFVSEIKQQSLIGLRFDVEELDKE